MAVLPYQIVTASGRRLEFQFPLHELTESEANVADVVTKTLAAIDEAIAAGSGYSDGDIIQALTLALAARVRMVDAIEGPVHQLARELTDQALAAPSTEAGSAH